METKVLLGSTQNKNKPLHNKSMKTIERKVKKKKKQLENNHKLLIFICTQTTNF